MNPETAELDYEIIWDDEDKPKRVMEAPLERKLDDWLMDAHWVAS